MGNYECSKQHRLRKNSNSSMVLYIVYNSSLRNAQPQKKIFFFLRFQATKLKLLFSFARKPAPEHQPSVLNKSLVF